MYCRKCGTQNDDNAYKCVQCGEIIQQTGSNAAPHKPIPNYLAQAILATLFCCLPFGIVAIVYAAQVNSKIQGGDIQGAMDSARKAKIWCWWSFGVGLAVAIPYLFLYLIAVAEAM